MKVCSQLLSQVQFGNGLRFVLRVCRLGRSGSGSHIGEEGRRVGQNGWLKSQALPAKSQASAGPWRPRSRPDAPRCCASVRRCPERRDLPPSVFCNRRLAGYVRGSTLRPRQLPEAEKFLEATQPKTQKPRPLEGQGKCLGSWGWSAP